MDDLVGLDFDLVFLDWFFVKLELIVFVGFVI